MKPGRYTNVLESDYHSGPGVSKSDLDLIHRSPMHYRYAKDNPEKKDTPAMMFGRALHCAVLEPERYLAEYCCEITKDDFPDSLDTVADLVTKLVNTHRRRLEGFSEAQCETEIQIESAESNFTDKEAEINKAIDAIDPDNFDTKKEYTAAIKPLKDQLRDLKSKHKDITAQLKTSLKDLRDEERTLRSKLKGTKSELIAEVKKADPKAVILDEEIKKYYAQHAGKTILKKSDYETIEGIKKSLSEHQAAEVLFEKGQNEVSYYWHDEKLGVLCRSRVDKVIDSGILIDFKTCLDASRKACTREIIKRRYDVQAAHYCDGFKKIHNYQPVFYFVFCEKQPPYGIALIEINTDWMHKALLERDEDLGRYYECSGFKWWPGYAHTVQTIEMPPYVNSEYQKLLYRAGENEDEQPS